MKPTLKAFTDDITVLAKGVEDAKRVLKRLDELISWTRKKFKEIKFRSCPIVKGKAKEIHFSIGGDQIPTIKEQTF